ncbi:YchJ family protein [Desulfovibrio litoralis]|uniref:SEC-C motif-containing protein n=1 Tax=Desulfovibrio litoralis DSM 11393 TaxID=1121455 RepID=A0A1M7TJV8_9BACT|nr:YchJ family protein [Desulfovibrio litoralis]SHN71034.1 SEC-C motif-containing protein [Desulfovibrio litoralis DSM 11393]
MLCPCGSEKELEQCCGPIIEGTINAETAEALMRSRYTAHVLKKYAYLDNSVHPDSRDGESAAEVDQYADHINWVGLEIVSVKDGGKDDTTGEVSFVARYKIKDFDQEIKEEAEFKRDSDGKWYYYSGKVHGHVPYKREGEKIGRNDPCSCGSGKKYKKCCATK